MVEISESYNDRQKVWELIKDVRIALLVTAADEGLRGRPMAAMNKDFDGELWFASRRDAPKLDEIKGDRHVLLAYSEPKTQNYVSVSGTARVSSRTAPRSRSCGASRCGSGSRRGPAIPTSP